MGAQVEFFSLINALKVIYDSGTKTINVCEQRQVTRKNIGFVRRQTDFGVGVGTLPVNFQTLGYSKF